MTDERETQLPGLRSCDTTVERPWGEGCLAWDLVARPALRVTKERMPRGTAEEAHLHEKAHQVFYVTEGILTVVRAGERFKVQIGEALEVQAGVVHRVLNATRSDVEFLVLASPTTEGDRRGAEPSSAVAAGLTDPLPSTTDA